MPRGKKELAEQIIPYAARGRSRGGAWGKQTELNRFLQEYAVEKAKIEARKKGYRVAETKLEDGSIKVTVTVGGGVA